MDISPVDITSGNGVSQTTIVDKDRPGVAMIGLAVLLRKRFKSFVDVPPMIFSRPTTVTSSTSPAPRPLPFLRRSPGNRLAGCGKISRAGVVLSRMRILADQGIPGSHDPHPSGASSPTSCSNSGRTLRVFLRPPIPHGKVEHAVPKASVPPLWLSAGCAIAQSSRGAAQNPASHPHWPGVPEGQSTAALASRSHV